MDKLNVFKLVDQYGWAFYYTTIEQQRYTHHNIQYLNWEDTLKNIDKLNFDIFYIPSPILCKEGIPKLINQLREISKHKNIKIIGAYSGLINTKYNYADLVMSIAINDLPILKNESLFPVTFLPESIDTNFFVPNKDINHKEFEIGWVGKHALDKRSHLLNELIFPVKQHAFHGKEYFKDGRDQQPVLDFYHSLNCFVLTSSHECMPRVILEAMACGLPIVATGVGSVPWMLDPEWIVPVNPENLVVKEINKKLKILKENEKLRIEVGNRNRYYAEKFFSWKENQILWDKTFSALYENNFEKIQDISKTYLKNLNTEKTVNAKKPKIKTNKKTLNILKVIDEFGWAYDFIYKGQIKYSKHILSRNTISNLQRIPHIYENDIVYFSGANMGYMENLTKKIKLQNGKIIGAYAGENTCLYEYSDVDLIVSISYPFTEKLKQLYPGKPVIFMPEAIDDAFFVPKEDKVYYLDTFKVGWAGRKAEVKRPHLLDMLKYPVEKMSNHSDKDLTRDRTLQPMLDFYHTLDVLVLTSKSECMPRVVLEAMACGLPVISTDVGSLRMLLDEEWLVTAQDEETIIKQFNEKLDLLKNNLKLRQEVGSRNRKHIEKYFNWKKIMPLWDKMFVALYKEDYKTIINISNDFIDKLNNKMDFIVEEPVIEVSIIETPVIKQSIIPVSNIETEVPPVKEIKPSIADMSLNPQEILELLIQSKINFWLLKESCLETIKYGEIRSEIINIGVKSETDKENIINFFKDFKVNLDITMEERKLKIHHCFGIEIQVPIPVVTYLTTYFNKPWNQLVGDNK